MFIDGPCPVMVNIPPMLATWLLGHPQVLKRDPLSGCRAAKFSLPRPYLSCTVILTPLILTCLSEPNYLLMFLAPLKCWRYRCFAEHREGGQSAGAARCWGSGPRPCGLRLVYREQAAEVAQLSRDCLLLARRCHQDRTQVKTISC